MQLNNLMLKISKEDVISLVSLQDKIIIKNLELGNIIKITGIYKFVGLNIDFEALLAISDLKNNIIHIDIKDFQISKKNSSNPLVKGYVSLLNKSINEIDGMNLNEKLLTIDIEKIIKSYCTEIYGIELKKLDISTLNTNNSYLEFGINILDINLNSVKILNDNKKKKK